MHEAAGALETVLAEATPRRGGMLNGEMWYGSLDEKCSWDALSAKAEENLMGKEPPVFEEPLDAVIKARQGGLGPRRGLSLQNRGSTKKGMLTLEPDKLAAHRGCLVLVLCNSLKARPYYNHVTLTHTCSRHFVVLHLPDLR